MNYELFRLILTLLTYVGENNLTPEYISSKIEDLKKIKAVKITNKIGAIELNFYTKAIITILKVLLRRQPMIEGGLTHMKFFGMLALSCLRIPGGSAEVIENAVLDS